jgi:hypothetical protein
LRAPGCRRARPSASPSAGPKREVDEIVTSARWAAIFFIMMIENMIIMMSKILIIDTS